MSADSRVKRLAGGLAVVAAALVVAGVALASQLSEDARSVTGCVTQAGDFTKVAVGDMPLKPCSGTQVQVHLDGDDLVSIVAGTGLVSESTNGVATLSIDSKYALPQDCEVNQVARWDGDEWLCSWDVVPLP